MKNLFYFILGMAVVVLLSAKPDPTPTPPSPSGSLVSSGIGYKLYKHNIGLNYVYVVKSTNSYPVAIAK